MNETSGALVTGAGGRIGRDIALALAAEGRAVAVHYNSSAAQARETAALIHEAGGRAVIVQCDFADPVATSGLIARVVGLLHALGARLDCIVNNASHFEYDDAADITARLFDRHMAVNVRAPALLARAFAKHVGAQRAGARVDEPPSAVIVNIIDQKVRNPDPDYLSYTLSKFALAGLTETLALTLAPAVRVVGVAPGLTLPSRQLVGAAFEAAAARLPLGRATSVGDIAAAVCYVASAPSITGQTIVVDSGQHMMEDTRDPAFAAPRDKPRNNE